MISYFTSQNVQNRTLRNLFKQAIFLCNKNHINSLKSEFQKLYCIIAVIKHTSIHYSLTYNSHLLDVCHDKKQSAIYCISLTYELNMVHLVASCLLSSFQRRLTSFPASQICFTFYSPRSLVINSTT